MIGAIQPVTWIGVRSDILSQKLVVLSAIYTYLQPANYLEMISRTSSALCLQHLDIQCSQLHTQTCQIWHVANCVALWIIMFIVCALHSVISVCQFESVMATALSALAIMHSNWHTEIEIMLPCLPVWRNEQISSVWCFSCNPNHIVLFLNFPNQWFIYHDSIGLWQ